MERIWMEIKVGLNFTNTFKVHLFVWIAFFKTTNKYLILSPHSQHFQKLILSTTFCWTKIFRKSTLFFISHFAAIKKKFVACSIVCSSCPHVFVGACYVKRDLECCGGQLRRDNWLLLTTWLLYRPNRWMF